MFYLLKGELQPLNPFHFYPRHRLSERIQKLQTSISKGPLVRGGRRMPTGRREGEEFRVWGLGRIPKP